MDECSMTVVIQTDSYCALTALSMTRMTSLSDILLVYFVANITFAISLNNHWQREIEFISHRKARFRFYNLRMVRSSLPHAQMNYHV